MRARFELTLDDVKVETPLKSATAFFDYFDASLNRLLASWVSGKLTDAAEIDEREGALVIFIDDLDRCLPDKVVQVLETIELFLDKRGCVFVLGADTCIVREAVTQHYKQAGFVEDNARDYLDNIIQIRFDLPQIGDIALAGLSGYRKREPCWMKRRGATGRCCYRRGQQSPQGQSLCQRPEFALDDAAECGRSGRHQPRRLHALAGVAARGPGQLCAAVEQHRRPESAPQIRAGCAALAHPPTPLRRPLSAIMPPPMICAASPKAIESFSDQFTPTALRAFSHLSALPAQPAPPPTPVETKPEAAPTCRC